MAIDNLTISGGDSIQYDTGGPNAVALDDSGNVVEVHVGTDRLFYRVGEVDSAKKTIAWGPSLQYDTGGPNAVALHDYDHVVEVHVGTDRLFYRVGKVNFTKKTIAWGPSIQYDTGGPNAVALDNNGNVVEVHVGTDRLFYRVGEVDCAKKTTAWGDSSDYGGNAIALVNSDYVVAVFYGGGQVGVDLPVPPRSSIGSGRSTAPTRRSPGQYPTAKTTTLARGTPSP